MEKKTDNGLSSNMRKRKGFSLVELIVVIIIIGILAVIGIGFGGKQVSSARMTTISGNMEIVASDIENAIVDLGFLESVSDQTVAKNYFETWENKYTTCPLNTNTITFVDAGGAFGSDFSGAIIETIGYRDPWDKELKIYYMIPVSGKTYRIIIASAGPNSFYSDDAACGYINNDYDDDVLMIMEPRDT